MKDMTGKAWGRFQILEEHGHGGMAVVYKARDGILRRTVALKALLPLLSANKEFTQRLRREAITAANVRHPNIVVIFDVRAHEQFQYIVMEYLEGPTLQREIQAIAALPTARVLGILGQLAGAPDCAQEQGLAYRDVKPANIIVGACDHITLTDFGLVKAARGSKITGESPAMETLRYMSPEQAMDPELDSRAAGLGSNADQVITTDALRRETILLLVTTDGHRLPVYRAGAMIGREATNDVVLPYRQVSRRHARIQCSQASCTVMDMGSANGTFVNDAPLPPRKRHPLRLGDQLGIGPVVLFAPRPASSGRREVATTGRKLGN
jgi:serine/threonine protein kinase